MWMSVSELALSLKITPRTVQKMVSLGQVKARKKDGKSFEVETASLPERWLKKLPESLKYSLPGLAHGTVSVNAASSTLGRTLSKKEKLKIEVQRFYRGLSLANTAKVRCAMTAANFGISESTVRRYVNEIEEYGVLGQEKKSGRRSSWSPEAIDYMKGYYLSFIKQTNIVSKKVAVEATFAKALEMGWQTGGRTSAYEILSEIPKILTNYAKGGDRALDNFFFIRRDWSALRPSQIWIGDQHICDFWVVDKSNPEKPHYYRPTLYVWEDGATRCIAGLAVDEDYSSETVLESLKMGIRRFGFFDCTYNDNGTSECSKAVTQIIDDLMLLSEGKSQMKDLSEMYRTESGHYIVEDPDGKPVSISDNPDIWRRDHRRIYANVRNAKAKPIERLFNTIETKMAQRGIPGHVVSPNAPAEINEKEQQVLDMQKAKGAILTLEEFMFELISGINEYEHTYHSSLRMSPLECMQRHIADGWVARRPNETDLEFIFLSRTKAKIRNGRVRINGIEYIGEELPRAVRGFADVGLTLHEGEEADLRFDRTDPSKAYAVFPASPVRIRLLKPVESISMLDDELMKNAIGWKRRQMKAVRDIFKSLEVPLAVDSAPQFSNDIVEAESRKIELPDIKGDRDIVKAINTKAPVEKRRKDFFSSDYEHYKWCLEEMIEGKGLKATDKAFMEEYETRENYEQEKSMWNTLKRLGGLD